MDGPTFRADLVAGLRAAGLAVHDYSRCGNGIPDLIVCRRQCHWVEVKAGLTAGLTEAESAFFERCPGGEPIIGYTADQVLAELDRREER
jgi:hypothetical protein